MDFGNEKNPQNIIDIIFVRNLYLQLKKMKFAPSYLTIIKVPYPPTP
jgi:hypothetical protein